MTHRQLSKQLYNTVHVQYTLCSVRVSPAYHSKPVAVGIFHLPSAEVPTVSCAVCEQNVNRVHVLPKHMYTVHVYNIIIIKLHEHLKITYQLFECTSVLFKLF